MKNCATCSWALVVDALVHFAGLTKHDADLNKAAADLARHDADLARHDAGLNKPAADLATTLGHLWVGSPLGGYLRGSLPGSKDRTGGWWTTWHC